MTKTQYLRRQLAALNDNIRYKVTAQLGRDYQYNPKAFTGPKWNGLKTAKDRLLLRGRH